jgi:hypothetical protein
MQNVMTTGKSASSSLRLVVFLQENKTTDFYFPTMKDWGAAVRKGPNLLARGPDFDQPHDRNAWVHYKMGDYPAVDVQIDNDVVIPFYSWLAKTYTFCDHHFGIGSNSTPGHLLAIGGQTPTLKNPPFGAAGPQWDLPSIFLHAQRSGVRWAAFPSDGDYPIKYYTELQTAAAKKNVHPPDDFLSMVADGRLPELVYAWSPSGFDEHPPSGSADPDYISRGQNLVWQRVDALVKAGQWDNTIFILTWDDWGGYADHLVTPESELVPDALHGGGFQVIGGSRIPLVLFGGRVRQGVDNQWRSHASIPKTIIDLFGLKAFGVPRVDTAISLVGRISPASGGPQPPAFGTAIVQPKPPQPTPAPVPPPPFRGPLHELLPPLVANHGNTIPAPTDGVVRAAPPKPPAPRM